MRPKCKWCGRGCKPNYERWCRGCTHLSYKHPISSSAEQKTCKEPGCSCEIVSSYNDNELFPKRIRGFGIFDSRLFCTKTCAVEWALKRAKTEVT